ncbi:phytase [Anabaena azotica]|uniref:phytase n=1 Tax=Anabaena azotica TaxID=197653 RepID=UPI0018EFB788|nr:phytase [Anabaena azotica]
MNFKNKRNVLTRASAILTLVTSFFIPSVGVFGNKIPLVSVQAQLETPANFDDDAGGNADADDPAIWVHPSSTAKSLVVGTLKDAGLAVYNLQGVQVQAIAAPPAPTPNDRPGRFNNVDLVYGFVLNGKKVDLAVVSDRGSDKLRIYRINPQAASSDQPALTDVTDANAPFIFSNSQAQVNEQATAYGLALYKERNSGRSFAFVSQRNRTAIAVVELIPNQGQITYRKLQQIELPSQFSLPNGTTWTPCLDPGELPQVEGMVVDQELGILYAGQEDVGIWKIRLPLDSSTPTLLDKVREFGVPYTYDSVEEECQIDFSRDPGYGGKHLSADVEGLTIYYANRNNQGYLLASSQGDNTFAVYERQDNHRFVGSFALVDSATVDGVQESDGAAVINVPLGREFPQGLLVTQDGDNTPQVLDVQGEPRANTNFKFTPWQSVAKAFSPTLKIEPDGWNPRTHNH